MGQTADAIEFDLERQRHALTARVARFERRVGDDVDTTRARTSEHVSGVKHAVASTGENAAHKVGSVAGATTGSGTAIADSPAEPVPPRLKRGVRRNRPRPRRPGSRR